MRRGYPELHHLFFVDDSLFFLKGTVENAHELKTILTKYCNASGQRINNTKSTLVFSREAAEGCCKEIEDELQIRRVHDLGKYPGLPSVWGRFKKEALGYIKKKDKGKINGWTTKTLN